MTQVAAGFQHSLVVTATGQLYAFGNNFFGELGITTTSNGSSPTPTLVTLPGQIGRVTKAVAGLDDSLVVTSNGQLYAFGYNIYGQLGSSTNSGTIKPNSTPTLVAFAPGTTIDPVATGSDAYPHPRARLRSQDRDRRAHACSARDAVSQRARVAGRHAPRALERGRPAPGVGDRRDERRDQRLTRHGRRLRPDHHGHRRVRQQHRPHVRAARSTGSAGLGVRLAHADVFCGAAAHAFKQSASRRLSGAKLAHSATGAGVLARKRTTPTIGTTFSFSVDQVSRITFSFHRTSRGSRVGTTCAKHTAFKASTPRCTHAVNEATLHVQAQKGRNTLHFEGRIGRRTALAPGSYRVAITTAGQAGNASAKRTLRFTIMTR